jgi:hypothetical protein
MILALMVSLAAPVLAVLAIIRACWLLPSNDRRDFYVQLPLATGLGLGVASCSYFLWLVLFGRAGAGYPIVETAVFLTAAVFWWARSERSANRHRPYSRAIETISPCLRVAQVACIVGVPICAIALILGALASPHGEWDAWAIWNLRARFLYRAGEHWREAFDPLMNWSHPDYPLLLPGAIARSWRYLGHESTIVPVVIENIFTFATAGLLAGSIAKLRGGATGLLAGVVLLSSDYFLRHGAYQYADTPLAFFILATIVLTIFHLRDPGKPRAPIALAGLCASCAAWTKNEGIVFLVCWIVSQGIAIVLPAARGRGTWSLLAAAAGLAPITAIVIYFKMALAPANDLTANLTGSMIRDYLSDPQRYVVVLRYFGKAFFDFGKGVLPVMAIYWLLAGRARSPDERRGLGCCVAALGLMFACDFFVYVVTPHDLPWHLKTSADRLLLQLLPSAMFVVFVSTRSLLARPAPGHRQES